MLLHPAVFLDRDGVIIENRADYVRSWADVSFLPGALEALRHLNTRPYRIIIITNQSAIGRGILALEEARSISERIVTAVEREGGRIDAVYMCPHAPWEGCNCRKPQPGLILQAAEENEIDLQTSYFIGDALPDLQAAQVAGIKDRILVLTGRGRDEFNSHETRVVESFSIYTSLLHAVNALFPG
ncbi:MAG: HAD-IIIA family hydrolase [Anaerolineales bacterium]|nr:HAD-IIIA family hydrolase [Anaerolineales bacterium]